MAIDFRRDRNTLFRQIINQTFWVIPPTCGITKKRHGKWIKSLATTIFWPSIDFIVSLTKKPDTESASGFLTLDKLLFFVFYHQINKLIKKFIGIGRTTASFGVKLCREEW